MYINVQNTPPFIRYKHSTPDNKNVFMYHNGGIKSINSSSTVLICRYFRFNSQVQYIHKIMVLNYIFISIHFKLSTCCAEIRLGVELRADKYDRHLYELL